MWMLLPGIGTMVFGTIFLVSGKVGGRGPEVVEGVPARIIGIIFMLPLPLGFLIWVVVVMSWAAQGSGTNSEFAENAAVFNPIEAGLILVCFFTAAIIFGVAAKTSRRKRRPPS